MLTQQQQRGEPLSERTKRGVIDYILHHPDQKFAIFCNNNHDSTIFGPRGSEYRERVRRFYQDLIRDRSRSRLDHLIQKYEQGEILSKRRAEEMLRTGRMSKKGVPTNATKSTGMAPKSVLKSASVFSPPENSRVRFADDEEMYEYDDLESVDSDEDDKPPPLLARGAAKKKNTSPFSSYSSFF
jgi:hypothetical protein